MHSRKEKALFYQDGELPVSRTSWSTLEVEITDVVDAFLTTAFFPVLSNFKNVLQIEMQTMLRMGVPPSKIVYANPCKQASHIRLVCKLCASILVISSRLVNYYWNYSY